ncbi:GNAT family N-acetyltransferase [Fundicoccus culcitae]|uniref:GNAT family N-acetyltransferase n=1 Tax=Fundicoccus culcitae TaxID=2969821 RepID=A0ABY5P6H9_9LACT|nr:GNAT family N-acetyltransferase [Fundicoccus culcitae]UUX34186.1 GNAT family N-acetyltransferase [Fundicoccus culcitae]
MKIKWQFGDEGPIIKDAHALREKVFIKEQNVTEAEEIDGYDSQCWHIVCYLDDEAVATARVSFLSDTQLKIQRVCVDSSKRGLSIGQQMLAEIERWAKEKQVAALVLSSQDHVIPFYEKSGYVISNPQGYLDARIPHHDMQKRLDIS